MADQRHIIDIILNARDNTASAFASALGNQEAFNRLQKDAEQQSKKTAEAVRQASRSQRDAMNEQQRSAEKLTKQSDDLLHKQVELERASKAYAQSLTAGNRSMAEQEQAFRRMNAARADFIKTMKEEKEVSDSTARSRANRIRDMEMEAEQAKALGQAYSTAAREREKEREASRRAGREELDALRERARLAQEYEARQRQMDEDRKRRQRDATQEELNALRQRARLADQYRATQARASQQELDQVRRSTEAYREYEKAIQRVREAQGRRRQHEERGEEVPITVRLDEAGARREATELAAELEGLIGHIRTSVDLDSGEATRHAVEVRAVMDEILGRDVKFHVEADVDNASFAKAEGMKRGLEDAPSSGGWTNFFNDLLSGVENGSNRIAAFDNLIRGLFTFLVTGFLQPLIVMAGAAGAALLALGSSALYAGGALAGGLAAGIAQALPMLGLLVTFATRITAVMKAVQQANLLQQQQSYQGAQQDKKRADSLNAVSNATDTLKNAQESLLDSHRRVGEAQQRVIDSQERVRLAQEKLREARKEAKRDLEDLILAERRAELQARGAALAQEDAQNALRQAIAQGRTADIGSRQLDVSESDLGRRQADIEAERARADASEARRRGVGRAPGVEDAERGVRDAQQGVEQAKAGVEDAKRAVENAERAVARARRGVEQARRGSDAAAAGITSAAGKLAFMESQLSSTEKKLMRTLILFQDRFRGFAQDVTEPLVAATDRSLRRIIRMLDNPAIRVGFRALSAESARAGEHIFKSFTNDRAIAQFLRIMNQAQRNLRPLSSAIANIGHAFLNIAEVAGPALNRMIRWIRDIAKEWNRWTSDRGNQKTMARFFDEGVTALQAWLRLLFSIVRLFLAIAGPGGGAKEGTKTVNDMTGAINKLTDNINKGGKASEFLHRMWRIMRQVFNELRPVFRAIAHELDMMFGDDGVKSVHGFATIMAQVLIPAFGHFIRQVGHAAGVLGDFLAAHPRISKMAAAVTGLMLSFGFASKLVAIFNPFINVVRVIATHLGLGTKAANLLRGAVFSVAGASRGAVLAFGAWGAVAAVILLLLKRYHLLDDVLRGLKRAALAFIKPIGDAFKDVAKDMGGTGDIMKDLDKVLRPLMTFVVRVLVPWWKLFATVMGNQVALSIRIVGALIKGAVGIITGFVRVVRGYVTMIIGFFKGLFTGDWGDFRKGARMALDGAKKIGHAIIDGLWSVLKAFGKFFVNIFKAAWNAVLDWLGIRSPSTKARSAGRALIEGLQSGLKGLASVLTSPFRAAWRVINRLLGGLPDKVLDAFTDLAGNVANAVTHPFDTVKDAVNWLIREVINRIPGVEIDEIKSKQPNKARGNSGSDRRAGRNAMGPNFAEGGRVGSHPLVNRPVRMAFGGAIRDKLGDAAGAISGAAKAPFNAIKGVINGVKDFAKKIATGWLKPLAEWIGDKVVDFAKDKFEGGVKGAAKKTPLGWAADKAGIFAGGGYVTGGIPGLDSVHALLAPDEFVVTPHGESLLERITGVPGILNWLQGAQRPVGFAAGGRASGKRGGSRKKSASDDGDITGTLTIDTEDAEAALESFVKKAKELWDGLFGDLRKLTKRGHRQIDSEFDDLAADVQRSMKRMGNRVADTFGDMAVSMRRGMQRGQRAVSSIMDNLTEVVYKGLDYIQTNTDKALKAFDAKPTKLSIERPKGDSKASGGYIGHPGERGGDFVPTWLGRGEAVLNWAHQKMVDPALRKVYGFGLGEMFGRTSAQHAGGGMGGYAGGGFVGLPSYMELGSSEEAAASTAAILKKLWPKYRFAVTDAYDRDHSAGHKSPGHNVTGTAADLVPSPQGGSWDLLESLGRWAVKKGLTVYYGTNGVGTPLAGHGRGNHMHIEFGGASGKGLGDIGIDEVGKQKVKGDGSLREMAQKIINKVTDAANSLIESMMPTGGGDTIPLGKGPNAKKIWDYMKGRGFTDQQAAGWLGNFQQESGLNPAAVQAGGPGRGLAQWGGGRFNALVAFARARGKKWTDLQSQLDFVWHELQTTESAAYKAIKSAKTIDQATAAIGSKYERFGIQGNRSGPAHSFYEQFHGKAGGGFVGGPPGKAVKVTAHAGEWIVNQAQQSKLAKAAGVSVGKLKSALGFSGGPKSFAGGGEVSPTADGEEGQTQNLLDMILALNPARVREEIRHEAHMKTLKEMRDKAEEAHDKERLKQIDAAIKAENKLHDQREKNIDKADKKLRAQFEKMDRPEQARQFAIRRGVYTAPTVLPTSVSGVFGEMRSAFTAIRRLGTQIQGARLTQFIRNIRALTDEGGLMDQLTAAIERRTQDAATALQLLTAGLRRVRRGASTVLRGTRPLTTASEIADQEIETLNDVYSDLQRQRRQARVAYEKTQARIRKLRKGGITKEEQDEYEQLMAARNRLDQTMDTIDAAIAQNRIDQFNKRIEKFNAYTQEKLRNDTQEQAGLDIFGRIGQALGNDDITAAVGNATLENIKRQTTILQDRLRIAQERAATDPRWQTTVDELTAQIGDNIARMAETQAQNLSNSISVTEAGFQRERTANDIRGRGADVRERLGDRLGAASARITVAATAADIDRRERARLGSLYQEAEAQGNVGAMRDLSEKLADLDMRAQENTVALRDATVTYRQVATELIQFREQTTTGFIGTAQGIIQKIGEITGNTNFATLLRMAQQTQQQLSDGARRIRDNIDQAAGGEFAGPAGDALRQLSEAFGTSPESFANKLSELAPALADMELNMSDTERSTFQALIQSMIDNTTATLDNTQQINELTGATQQPQTFSSTAWSWFREAVFTGMGDVLPSYAIPQMQSGGHVTRTGLFNLHAGEFVVNPEGSNAPVKEGDTYLEINEAGGPIDITHLTNRLAFAKKTASITR